MSTFNAPLIKQMHDQTLTESKLKPIALDHASKWIAAIQSGVRSADLYDTQQNIDITVVARGISPLIDRIVELEAQLVTK